MNKIDIKKNENGLYQNCHVMPNKYDSFHIKVGSIACLKCLNNLNTQEELDEFGFGLPFVRCTEHLQFYKNEEQITLKFD